MPRRSSTRGNLQSYERKTGSLLAKDENFPKLDPPMEVSLIESAVDAALARTSTNKSGGQKKVNYNATELAKKCLQHLKERGDPIYQPYFYSQIDLDEVFIIDATSHEMQRRRMDVGLFYQYLILELMKKNSTLENKNIISAFDGTKEGDAVADINTHGVGNGLRIYMSIKKSADTVGGQDFAGVVKRLEKLGREDQNLSSPYMAVFSIATPFRGRIESFEEGRSIKNQSGGDPYSNNLEVWTPGFIFPYLTGRSPEEIYKLSMNKFINKYRACTLQYRDEASAELKRLLIEKGLVGDDNKIDKDKFFKYLTS